MILFYNILLILFSVLLLPLILLIVLGRSKYRGRSLERLGFRTAKIKNSLADIADSWPIIWIHALSVGEVTSALPLVKAVRENMKQVVVVFTAATSSGKQLADTLISPYAQLVLYSPFDLRFGVQRYLTVIRPSLFILVETDFWPNLLSLLKKNNIPILLVNGRVSEKSFTAYKRFSFFFKPMFRSFDLLSMQTAEERNKMIELGLPADRVITLGNLKYDMDNTAQERVTLDHPALTQENEKIIWVCGSTHSGEEELLFAAFKQLIRKKIIQEEIFLILAPRHISRGNELVQLARRFGLEAHTRSGKTVSDKKVSAKTVSEKKVSGNVLILDTLGELASCYSLAELAFVGGSLVRQGGHNPIEPAAYGVPVLFGPHMEDFAEIAQDLIACDGAKTVDADSLTNVVSALLVDRELRSSMGLAAKEMVEQHRGGVHRHIQAIQKLLR